MKQCNFQSLKHSNRPTDELTNQLTDTMKTKIIQYLKELEIQHNIKILYACETGSRAWGFASPDSDYDVRFIYIHKADWYLSLFEGKDSIELMLDDNLIDITGWELRKSLRLLKKSNVSILERIQSPIVYIQDDEFLTSINQLANSFYSKVSSLHHYLGLAKKSLSDVNISGNYKLKRLFYALRAAVCCNWIVERDEIPPIFFTEQVNVLSLDTKIRSRIYELIDLKSEVNETYMHSGESNIINFIKETIETSESKICDMPSSDGKTEDLSQFLSQTISKNNDNF